MENRTGETNGASRFLLGEPVTARNRHRWVFKIEDLFLFVTTQGSLPVERSASVGAPHPWPLAIGWVSSVSALSASAVATAGHQLPRALACPNSDIRWCDFRRFRGIGLTAPWPFAELYTGFRLNPRLRRYKVCLGYSDVSASGLGLLAR